MSFLSERSGTILYASQLATHVNALAQDTTNTCHLIVRCDAIFEGDLVFTGPNACIEFADGSRQCTATLQGATGPVGPVGPTGLPGPSLFTSYTYATKNADFSIPSASNDVDYYNVYGVDTSGLGASGLTVTLPAIATLDNDQKRLHYLVDVGGNLAQSPLIVQTSGGDAIANDTSVRLELDYGSLQLMSDGVNRWLIV